MERDLLYKYLFEVILPFVGVMGALVSMLKSKFERMLAWFLVPFASYLIGDVWHDTKSLFWTLVALLAVPLFFYSVGKKLLTWINSDSDNTEEL
jgi:hypothetical protein